MGLSRRIYHQLVDIEDIIGIIEKFIKLRPLGIESVEISCSVGRVLAEDVKAKISIPSFTRSLMDGYAVISDDVAKAYEDNPIRLKLAGKVLAGEVPSITLKRGECIEIATGAPLPFPANAIVPVEYTRRKGNIVEVYRRVAPGENVDYIASDLVQDQIIAWKDDIITPSMIGAIASAGVKKVKVYRKPIVAILSIGNELTPLGQDLKYGMIYESNSSMIMGLLSSIGADVRYMGIVRDNYDEIKEAINKALSCSDMVITIGGTSAGLEDLTYRVLSEYKPGIIIHGIKTKPGRPTAISIAKDKIIIALPGFPISCLTAAQLIVVPIIRKLLGYKISRSRVITAELVMKVPGALGLNRLVPTIVSNIDDKLRAYPLLIHSGAIGKLSQLDGYIIVPPTKEGLKDGIDVDVHLYEGVSLAEAVFIGSHCPLAEQLLLSLKKKHRIKIVYLGSLAGIRLVSLNIADFAGSHLLDSSGEYNVPFIKRYRCRDIVVIRGYVREQGFIFRQEHSSVINDFEDIIKNKLRFVNRNRGSGTRLIVDNLLKELAYKYNKSLEEIRNELIGYNYETTTHDGVALIISKKIADVGVGLRFVAEKYGLSFKPIGNEVYDFIINKKSLKKMAVEEFLKLIKDELPALIRTFPGYSLHKNSGEVIYEC